MSDKYTDLLDTADRIAVVDLYPARLRTVISDLSAALRETSALLTESRDYGSALVEELRARTEKLDQLLLLANSMDADFESYAKAHPAVQPDAAAIREAALRAALDGLLTLVEHANFEEGWCCCGDDMLHHQSPMDCGHTPVDMGEYHASLAIKEARAALKGDSHE